MATNIRNYGPPPSGDQQSGGKVHDGGKKGVRNYNPSPLLKNSMQDSGNHSYKAQDNMPFKEPKLSGGYK